MERELKLGDGLILRAPAAMELLAARREALELARELGERPLCSNACLVARGMFLDGEEKPLFADGREALIGLSVGEILLFALQMAQLCRGEGVTVDERGFNLNFDPEKFEKRGAAV